MICSHHGCNRWLGPGVGARLCIRHIDASDVYQEPPARELPPAELTALYARHQREVDNGTWPQPDCPVCRWIIAKPDATQRWLSQRQHANMAA